MNHSSPNTLWGSLLTLGLLWGSTIALPTSSALMAQQSSPEASQATLSVDSLLAPFSHNPIVPGLFADPEILYSQNTHKFYIYPTSDGYDGWRGDTFRCFSSEDMVSWHDEGVILDLKRDVSWANERAWAPCIEERRLPNGQFRYYFYFTAETKIGVAVADSPTGPFTDLGHPLIAERPASADGGQCIDPDVFTDPASGKTYLYWGNHFMAISELDTSLTAIVPNTTRELIHSSKLYKEGTYVFQRKGRYYFMWSQGDTRSPDYCVRYAVTSSPTETPDVEHSRVVLTKNPDLDIYAAGHNSVVNVPGTDIWYIVYHRFRRPNGVKMGRQAGYNRELCVDRLLFDDEGNILPVVVTP